MATGNVNVTSAASFIPEMWRDAILDYAERKFQLRNQVLDFSSMVSSGGDILNIPKVSEEAVNSSGKAADTAVVYERQTDANIQLSLNEHHYNAKRIEDIVRVQESADLFNAYAQSMGYALAKKVENFIALKIQSATGNDVTLGTDNEITTALLRSGLQKLLDKGFDYTDGETYFYCSPASYMYLMGLGELTEAQKRGDEANPISSGMIMQTYGMPVYASVDWDDDGTTGDETASIFKKDSVYFAQQIAPRVQSGYDIDHLATRVVADTLFGAALSHGASDADMGIVNFNNP